MNRHNFGTAIRRDINAQMLGKALAAPGIDQRYWCSFGTVCTIDPESGKMDPTDKLAIYCDSAGVDVDVELEPLRQPCTCKYAGIQAGDVTIMAPIRPGDIVLVECPDGDLCTPVITHIMQSRSKRQPTEDGKPIFDNNRLLVYAKNVPIDIRTAGGAKLVLQQDGTIEASNENGADVQLKADGSVYVKTSTLITMEGAVPAVDFVAKGTAQNAQLITAFNELSKAMTAIGSAFSSIPVPCPECATAATVMSDVAAALPTTLSTIAKVGA
jgi:hypothetical protein